jgi:hypothetical protein
MARADALTQGNSVLSGESNNTSSIAGLLRAFSGKVVTGFPSENATTR